MSNIDSKKNHFKRLLQLIFCTAFLFSFSVTAQEPSNAVKHPVASTAQKTANSGKTSDKVIPQAKKKKSSIKKSKIWHSPVTGNKFYYQPLKTGTPRDTIKTFIRLREELEAAFSAYRKEQTYENSQDIYVIVKQMIRLLDLSLAPKASKLEQGGTTIAYLLDIFGRIDLPPLESIPENIILSDNRILDKWQIPKTPIKITLIDDGLRDGEYLFSPRTLKVAPSFYKQIDDLPLKSSLGIESWYTLFSQLHGPAIPAYIVDSLPEALKENLFGTPLWKSLLAFLVLIFIIVFIVIFSKFLNYKTLSNKIPARLRHFIIAFFIIISFLLLKYIIDIEINVAGAFAEWGDAIIFIIINFSLVWIFWLIVVSIFDWIILSPRIPDESLDAELLRLIARIIAFTGSVFIIAYGANDLGLPVLGVFAGLGVGGLAVALAIQPTLENLIAGFILFLDKPVRIGDFCSFDDQMGTVESIGLRSTKIRARNRTLISIPNASLANMKITNWAHCDQMLIQSNIGLRYETDVDQLRYVLVKLREMFLAHPSIDNETVRIRFTGFGSSSIDIEIRVYALACEWNGFYAIREDVMLRVKEIVEESGTGFAFPSQTLYMGKDDGLDENLTEKAKKRVKSWRNSNSLPFPYFNSKKIDSLKNTLDYPPKGSMDKTAEGMHFDEEPLSVEPLSHEDENRSEKDN